MQKLFARFAAQGPAEGRLAWLDKVTLIWLGLLFLAWTAISMWSLVRQDWMSAVLQLTTGIFVLVSGLFHRVTIYHAHQAQRRMDWARSEFEKLLYARQKNEQLLAQDPEAFAAERAAQIIRHFLN